MNTSSPHVHNVNIGNESASTQSQQPKEEDEICFSYMITDGNSNTNAFSGLFTFNIKNREPKLEKKLGFSCIYYNEELIFNYLKTNCTLEGGIFTWYIHQFNDPLISGYSGFSPDNKGNVIRNEVHKSFEFLTNNVIPNIKM